MSPTAPSPITWPDGKRFAFTVFDDTDNITMQNGPPVYDLFAEMGLLVTKSVWPVAPTGRPTTGGATCADPDYLAWVLGLREFGHEIGFHNASDHSSTREETIEALDRFRELFGHDPRSGADHSENIEAVYWDAKRLTGMHAQIYGRAMKAARPHLGRSQGEVPTSPYFWADVLRDRIDYWRNFTFDTSNVLEPAPETPYHDPRRPFVNHWFAACHAPNLSGFLALLDGDRLDRLEHEGGVCIAYTHVGLDFAPMGQLDPRLRPALERLAARDPWFAPTSTVLDHLRSTRGHDRPISDRARAKMERRWLSDQLRARGAHEIAKAVKYRWRRRTSTAAR
jgi:hypothetical protein